MAKVTESGITIAAKLLNGKDSPAPFTYLATGTGSTAESSTHTALISENAANGSARATSTVGYTAPNKATWTHTWSFTGNVTVREIGVFNAPSSGTMLLRHVLAADKNYVNGESLEVTLEVTVGETA